MASFKANLLARVGMFPVTDLVGSLDNGSPYTSS